MSTETHQDPWADVPPRWTPPATQLDGRVPEPHPVLGWDATPATREELVTALDEITANWRHNAAQIRADHPAVRVLYAAAREVELLVHPDARVRLEPPPSPEAVLAHLARR